MATRTATRVAVEKAVETKARSDANGDLDREARELLEKKLTGEVTEPGGNVLPEPKPRTRKPPTKEMTAKSGRKPATALAAPEGFKSWTDPKLATAVVRMKTKEKKSIKQIAEALSLPAEHRSWFAVSKVWRETADAKGIDRPRLSPEAIEARKAKRAAAQ